MGVGAGEEVADILLCIPSSSDSPVTQFSRKEHQETSTTKFDNCLLAFFAFIFVFMERCVVSILFYTSDLLSAVFFT